MTYSSEVNLIGLGPNFIEEMNNVFAGENLPQGLSFGFDMFSGRLDLGFIDLASEDGLEDAVDHGLLTIGKAVIFEEHQTRLDLRDRWEVVVLMKLENLQEKLQAHSPDKWNQIKYLLTTSSLVDGEWWTIVTLQREE